MKRVFLFVVVGLISAASVFGGEPKVELLWPKGAPGALGDRPEDKPTLTIYLPEESKSVGSAVIICPGGGYGHLAVDHEGHQIARWLNDRGIAGFILEYRHRGRGYGHPAPLDDAQRAIRSVRSRAQEFKLDASKIGIMGFSAGGHLASTAATHFDNGNPQAGDPVERVSSRPDFAILCYAVIALDESFSHGGSRKNLLGENPAPALVRSLSNDKQVTDQTPPTFLFQTDADTGVPAENSVMFYLALRQHGVPAEMHIFQPGRHGLGLAAGTPGTELWPLCLEAWLKGLGMAK